MQKICIAIILSFLCVLTVKQPLCADESESATDYLEIPLVSSSSRVLFREDFRKITEIIAKSDDVSTHETARIAMPYSSENSLVLWNLSYGSFYPLADWLYLPLYGGLTAGYAYGGTADFSTTTLSLGSGFVLDFYYLTLGMGVNFTYDSNKGTPLLDSDFLELFKPSYVLYPVLNTGKFPFLEYVEAIAGEFSIGKTESPDALFENFAWATKLVFKYLFEIPVFDLYVKSGKNDFFPEYDLSENYTGFDSITYGGIIGTETFSVEGSYTMITGTIQKGDDSAITDNRKRTIHYPFGLNGFPSLTLHWRPGESYWYLRLSTAQGIFFLSEDDFKKYPVIPTIGIVLPSFDFFGGRKSVLMGSFSIPFIATLAVQMYL
jgi:hypothetical protein